MFFLMKLGWLEVASKNENVLVDLVKSEKFRKPVNLSSEIFKSRKLTIE